MSPDTIVAIGRQAIEITVLLLAILLLPSLLVGVLVSMFQAATQINEMTLTFIPKLLVVFLVLLFGGTWMLGLVVDYTRRLIDNIPGLIG